MKRFVIGCLIISFALLNSCSTALDAVKEGQSIVMVYVEEIHKPVGTPQVELYLEGVEKPLTFAVKAPAAIAVIEAPGRLIASSWSAKGNTVVNGPESFEFTTTDSAMTLLPYKITLVSKSQIEIRALTALDLEYARGQFASHEEYKDMPIIYPEIVRE